MGITPGVGKIVGFLIPPYGFLPMSYMLYVINKNSAAKVKSREVELTFHRWLLIEFRFIGDKIWSHVEPY